LQQQLDFSEFFWLVKLPSSVHFPFIFWLALEKRRQELPFVSQICMGYFAGYSRA
jgi:hypothetical protein